jgi:hypothetical protein
VGELFGEFFEPLPGAENLAQSAAPRALNLTRNEPSQGFGRATVAPDFRDAAQLFSGLRLLRNC